MALLCFAFLPGGHISAQENPPVVIPAVPSQPQAPAAPVMPDGARCFTVNNTAPYTVYGTIITNFYVASDGTASRKRSNFRLESHESTDFCSFGPFYGENEDRLKLTLRTLIPIFSCEFTAEGELNIFGVKKPEGGTRTWANCL